MKRIFELIKKENTSLTLVAIGMLVVGLAFLLFLWCDVDFNISSKINSEKFGQIGDFIGGIVGSIWALAGVLLFYIALTEQRKDIKTNQEALGHQITALNNQVKEFELQRQELASSRKVYEQQSKTLKIQQFESNFYSLLNIYMAIKTNLNSLVKDGDYFKNVFTKFSVQYIPGGSSLDHQKKSIDSYIKVFNEEKGHLSHYFKSIYRILKIIDSTANFTKEERVFYGKILRAQITDFEQLVLYYNSHSFYGIKAQRLILEYNLLKHIELLEKPEFAYYDNIQKDYILSQFIDFLTDFFSNHINKFYEIEFDEDKIVEEFLQYSCLVGIYFNENIEVKLFFNKDITENNILLSEDDFSEFLNMLILERVVHNTYLNPNQLTISKYKTKTEENTIFGFKLVTDSKLSLNRDEY